MDDDQTRNHSQSILLGPSKNTSTDNPSNLPSIMQESKNDEAKNEVFPSSKKLPFDLKIDT